MAHGRLPVFYSCETISADALRVAEDGVQRGPWGQEEGSLDFRTGTPYLGFIYGIFQRSDPYPHCLIRRTLLYDAAASRAQGPLSSVLTACQGQLSLCSASGKRRCTPSPCLAPVRHRGLFLLGPRGRRLSRGLGNCPMLDDNPFRGGGHSSTNY